MLTQSMYSQIQRTRAIRARAFDVKLYVCLYQDKQQNSSVKKELQKEITTMMEDDENPKEVSQSTVAIGMLGTF